jgi:coenzyme Q-binding protein COQ10
LHHHALTKVLPYSPEQLFLLVGDVARYPEFVPWLTSMRTWNVRYLRERFATRVLRDADKREINVSLLHGPFKALKNDWRFEPDPAGTKIVFSIDFAFKSRILDALLHANMDRAVAKLIGCFEARAAADYGEANSPIS